MTSIIKILSSILLLFILAVLVTIFLGLFYLFLIYVLVPIFQWLENHEIICYTIGATIVVSGLIQASFYGYHIVNII